MREIRIYQPGDYTASDELELSSEARQHVATVLRMQVGDKLTLFCGNDHEFYTQIKTIDKKKIIVTILAECNVSRESSRCIHLAQAISKTDSMEFVVQKAVELGVTEIIPLITERICIKWDSTRMEKKIKQWQGIIIAACEQSGRNQLPTLAQPISLLKYLQLKQTSPSFYLNPKASKTWRDYTPPIGSITLLVGPEGGLSSNEIEKLTLNQFNPLYLGPRILRTETAAIAALSIFQAIYGDF